MLVYIGARECVRKDPDRDFSAGAIQLDCFVASFLLMNTYRLSLRLRL